MQEEEDLLSQMKATNWSKSPARHYSVATSTASGPLGTEKAIEILQINELE